MIIKYKVFHNLTQTKDSSKIMDNINQPVCVCPNIRTTETVIAEASHTTSHHLQHTASTRQSSAKR